MTFRVAVTGASGQVGRAVISSAPTSWDVSGTDSSTVDIRDWAAVRDWLASIRPNLVIHAAAMTDVDGCESQSADAFAINALGTRHVARAAASVGAMLIYVSTNFVFDGERNEPYHEFDEPNPISIYGASKRAGETEAITSHPSPYVVRTAMVYDETGHNFVNTMKRLMRERESLSVVEDQFGSPTYAPDFAAGVLKLIRSRPPGTYHMTNTGSTSWFGWAAEIQRITGLDCVVQRTTAAEYPRAAKPPRNGTMTSLAWTDVAAHMPDWRDALRRCLT